MQSNLFRIIYSFQRLFTVPHDMDVDVSHHIKIGHCSNHSASFDRKTKTSEKNSEIKMFEA